MKSEDLILTKRQKREPDLFLSKERGQNEAN